MDQITFEKYALRARERAVSAAVAISGDSDAAEDVSQEVMLKLWGLHAELEAAEDMLRLAPVIARRMAIDVWRRRKPLALSDVDVSALAADAAAATSLEAEEERAWLEQRLAQLPPTAHEILRLRQVEGRTNDEIAALLGLTKPSVATILSRARRQLLAEFEARRRA